MLSQSQTQPRLSSLDVLRGFDLFLLLFFQPVVVVLLHQCSGDWRLPILGQLEHTAWEGFTFWDIIMPLFLFMTGVAMPFSFSKFSSKPIGQVYSKVFRRVILLFVGGMIVQGNLLALGNAHLIIYSNTLQAIAVGYLITSSLLIHLKITGQLIALVSLLIIYWIPMQLCGDYSMEGNFSSQVDRYFLGSSQGDPSYTWIWSSLNFGATVLIGALSGEVIRAFRNEPYKILRYLIIFGCLLIAIALLWSPYHPIIKRIWTSSMVLFSGGICLLLLALFYYVIDVTGWNRGIEWLKIYGVNSIAAYLIGEVVDFRSIPASICYGLAPYFGRFYPVWLTFSNCLILLLILHWMYKHKIFIKV
jgi:predicted acyltransferase